MPSIETIEEVRHYLHQNPEISGEESQTSSFLQKFISQNYPDYKIWVSQRSYGFIATKKYGEGKHVALRAELDALPIIEDNQFEYKSQKLGASHACGHDGHMATLLATLQRLEDQGAKFGTVSFLFQPAEETGKGAQAILDDEVFDQFEPDALIALHNIPGKPLGLILSRAGTFACGSVGLRLKVHGKTSHAAHPEESVNPLLLSKTFLDDMLRLSESREGFSLATPIALHSGQDTFGISPLDSTLLMTLRAADSSQLKDMMAQARLMVEQINSIDGATAELTFEEFFPITSNDHFHSDLEEISSKLKRPLENMEEPFRWSEDFGHYAKRCKTHMFGHGAGIEASPLHAATYDFPDELIQSGAEIFVEFYNHMLRK
jgi:amidohydrolase